MDSRVRKVLARYYESPGGIPPDRNMPWMDYLEDKSKIFVDPNNPVREMLKGKKHLNKPFNTTNPYDYKTPNDMPKDQKDSPPFTNEPDVPTTRAQFNRPNLFGEQGALEDWYRARREDWTTDEDEQQPALSLTRKKSSVEGVPKEYLTGFTVSGNDFYDFVLRSKVAASFGEIIDKDYHYKNDLKMQRADKCQAIWANKNNPKQYERGLFTFRVSTPGSTHGPHNVYLQFLRDDNISATKYIDYPVHIGCTCKSFLFSGAQYYAVRDGYMYMPAFKPDLVAPKTQDQYTISVSQRYPNGKKNPGRGLNSRVCKHILAVFDEIKNTPIEVHYKKYPIYSPPSSKIDSVAWEKMMKIPFTEKDIKDRLLSSSPKVPAYFRRESMTPSVIDWFKNTWFPRTDSQKIKSLNEFSMYPERVFFILIEEAYLKRQNNEHISILLVDAGYDLMEKVVQPDNPAEGQVTPENDDGTVGTGPVNVTDSDTEDISEETKNDEKEKSKKKIKEYGGEMTKKKVRNPGRLKRPSTVQPAIK